MDTLIVGFDSAWTQGNSGALVGALMSSNGVLTEIGLPISANYTEAQSIVLDWQSRTKPGRSIILLDQPTIVKNSAGQRPVENLVSSPVSKRYGGVQPANTSKAEMFGPHAPIWPFLEEFGGAADPNSPSSTSVYETYPVLTMIALNWILPDSSRTTGRLPKYNPERRKTFSLQDWNYVVDQAKDALAEFGLPQLSTWLEGLAKLEKPKKADQDQLDACLCLIAGLYLATNRKCLMVGNTNTGYIIVPHGSELSSELNCRCVKTGKDPMEWVKSLVLT